MILSLSIKFYVYESLLFFNLNLKFIIDAVYFFIFMFGSNVIVNARGIALNDILAIWATKEVGFFELIATSAHWAAFFRFTEWQIQRFHIGVEILNLLVQFVPESNFFCRTSLARPATRVMCLLVIVSLRFQDTLLAVDYCLYEINVQNQLS